MLHKNIMSLLLLTSLSISAQTFQVNPEYLRTSIQGVDLLFEDGAFMVHKDGNTVGINSHDVAKELRNVKANQLERIARMSKLHLRQYDNGDYMVSLAGGLNGGGPIAAVAANVAVRAVGYSASIFLMTCPGGQAPALWVWTVTDSAAMVASGAAAVMPTV